MATTVKIIYTGPAVEADRQGQSIYRMFVPDNSYVDGKAYTEGYTNPGSVGDGNSYGKSIYATNVDGWGSLPGLLPMASTTVKFAEFERAVLAAYEAKKAGTTNAGITFSIDGYEEELYWNQMAANMWETGFYIEVGSNKYGEEPAEESSNSDTSETSDNASGGNAAGGKTNGEDTSDTTEG